MIKESEKFAQQDKELKEGIDARINLESYISTVKITIDDEKFKTIMGNDICGTIYDKLNEVINWLSENEKNTKDIYDNLKHEIELIVSPEVEDFIKKTNG